MADRFVKISAANARLMFTECGPACIAANGCEGKCCDAPSRPTGCMVTIHPSEQADIEALGAQVVNGFIQPKPGQRGCPFKQDGLCQLHFGPHKPFGCIASPFTLTAGGTLIVRNRYKLLPCYRGNGPKQPAYRAFYSSLVLLFGARDAAFLAGHFDSGGGDILGLMSAENYAKLRDNDLAKHQAKEAA